MKLSGPQPLTKDPNRKRGYLFASACLFALVAASLAVAFLLPAILEPEKTSSPGNAHPAKVEKANITPTMLDKKTDADAFKGDALQPLARQRAENLLREVLRKQRKLEEKGGKTWGAHRVITSYPEAMSAIKSANRDFDRADYLSALAGFERGLRLLERLEASKDKRFRLAIAEGNAALNEENPVGANISFSVAVALKPDAPRAIAGLKRARSLSKVLELMKQGHRLNMGGDLDGSHLAFRTATEIDPEYRPAREEALRTSNLIADREYLAAISRAIKAIEIAKFDDGELALSEARKIRSKSREVAELSSRLSQARTVVAIASLMRTAKASMRDEDWKSAADAYNRILAIDPASATALTGEKRSSRMWRIHQQINVYLLDPDRLSFEKPLEHARQLLDTARAEREAGPRLQMAISKLDKLIVEASRPLPVILESDGETTVTIYRVARFGTFTLKHIELRPGKYTAVGARPGYRDVRVDFRIPGSGDPTKLVVQCTERI